MELQLFDILLLFILAFVLSLVVGFNVLYMVNKKLNEIQINVPACPAPVCPTPVCSSVQYPYLVDNNAENTNSKHTDKKIIKQNIENFESVGTDKPVTKPNPDKADKPASNPASIPASKPVLKDNFILKTDGTDTQLVKNDSNMGYNLKQNTCRPYTGSNIKENSYNTITTGFMLPTSDNPDNIVKQQSQIYVPMTYMGIDPDISGISYAALDLENPADVDQIGAIPINDYTAEPVPISSTMSDS